MAKRKIGDDDIYVLHWGTRDLRKRRKRRVGSPDARDPAPRLNPDARIAIEEARRGQCRAAAKHLYDAAPHIQRSGHATQADRESFRLASIIVAQHCSSGGGSKYAEAFSGAGRRKKKRRR